MGRKKLYPLVEVCVRSEKGRQVRKRVTSEEIGMYVRKWIKEGADPHKIEALGGSVESTEKTNKELRQILAETVANPEVSDKEAFKIAYRLVSLATRLEIFAPFWSEPAKKKKLPPVQQLEMDIPDWE